MMWAHLENKTLPLQVPVLSINIGNPPTERQKTDDRDSLVWKEGRGWKEMEKG